MNRTVFLRGIGVIYFLAFASLLPQWRGLVGSHGISPAFELLEAIRSRFGIQAFTLVPSLAWISPSDAFLQSLIFAGLLASWGLILGIFPIACSIIAWLTYGSLVNVGGEFLSYQWESLLLETGFLSILLASFTPTPKILIWMGRWLLFRLLFSSGIVKVTSDAAWRDLTALDYHFFTQPLPTWIAWYLQNFPPVIHKGLTLVVLISELIIPFLFFFPAKRLRKVAFWIEVVLQGAIALTGNYTYFNLLTILLCGFLLWDETGKSSRAVKLFSSVLFSAGLIQILFVFGIQSPRPLAWVAEWQERFQIVHGYGLFAVMTKERKELEIQGSSDGENWKAYHFRWKPEDIHQRPRFIAPYQPRIDWQAWFASMSIFERQYWLQNLLSRILENESTVLDLLADNPFKGKPPKFARVVVYDYRFTNWEEKSRTGAWWVRSEATPYSPVISLDNYTEHK